MAANPVNQSVREIDQDSWLLGDRFTLSKTDSPVSDISWGAGNGSFYNLTIATERLPQSRALAETSHIPKVHDAGGASAVWLFGEAVVKVKVIDPRATREHVTLDYVRSKSPSIVIPDVLFRTDYNGRYYIIQQKLPGSTLASLWPTLNNDLKQGYVSRIAGVCEELGAYLGDGIYGVDGNHLADLYLSPRGSKDSSPSTLLRNCKALNMDCSKFHFYHCDLGPGSIIIGPAFGSFGIIDWETAGFVPLERIRTKFRVSSGIDLPCDDPEMHPEWRRLVQKYLGTQGYPEIADQWMAWWMGES
ncbi:unnamed protein product [Clonostachys chloroleuca]|uniref:Aminoglycoside phosphotransferase domain-containing protein n=1 Tax=Clonostachys chloroleuca TaxID=1926264 RepID=A0AA35PSM3_9HYPO|nr:unnamed protein product [Clonostachys chloroleuca]